MNTTNTKQTVQMARQVCPVELAALQATASDALLNGHYRQTQYGGNWLYPCSVTESFTNIEAFLSYLEEKTKAGIERYPHIQPFFTATLWQISHYQTQEEIASIMAASALEVEKQYLADIEAHNLTQQNLLIEQMVQAELAKESKREEQRLQGIRDKATKTAQEFIQSQLKQETN